MTAPTLEAERSAFEAFLKEEAPRDYDASNADAWHIWQAASQAARRTAAPVAGGVALPPLPDALCRDDTDHDVDYYTAEQVRQAQRDAVEADRRSRISADQWASLEAARLQLEAAKLNRESRGIAYIDGRTAGTAEAWQPIETAPKDREIWAFNGEQARMKWSEGDCWALWVWADDLLQDADPSPDQPTHWMPLAAAPSPLPPQGEDK